MVLRDRKHLAQDGLITVVVTLNSETGQIIAGPDIVSRGFIYVREAEDLMDNLRQVACDVLNSCLEDSRMDWATMKSTLKNKLSDYLFQKTKRNPMILPIIMEI